MNLRLVRAYAHWGEAVLGHVVVRIGARPCLAAVVVGITALLILANAGSSALGKGGTVEIRQGDDDQEGENEGQHESISCDFFVVGHDFAGGSVGQFSIETIPPSRPSGTVVAQDSWTADESGDWQSNQITLASGHYRITAEQVTPAAKKEAHKNFWVECAPVVIPEAPVAVALPVTGSLLLLGGWLLLNRINARRARGRTE